MNIPGPRIKKIKPSDIDRLRRRIAQAKATTGADISQIEESILSITAGIEDIRARINLLHPPPTYSYTCYAIDDQGTGFAKIFNPATHKYKGIYVSLVQLTDPQVTVNLFEGRWEIYAPTYTYTRYASDNQGSNFSATYIVGTHTHRAIITHTYLSSIEIVPALFAGKWVLWAPDDTYDGGVW